MALDGTPSALKSKKQGEQHPGMGERRSTTVSFGAVEYIERRSRPSRRQRSQLATEVEQESAKDGEHHGHTEIEQESAKDGEHHGHTEIEHESAKDGEHHGHTEIEHESSKDDKHYGQHQNEGYLSHGGVQFGQVQYDDEPHSRFPSVGFQHKPSIGLGIETPQYPRSSASAMTMTGAGLSISHGNRPSTSQESKGQEYFGYNKVDYQRRRSLAASRDESRTASMIPERKDHMSISGLTNLQDIILAGQSLPDSPVSTSSTYTGGSSTTQQSKKSTDSFLKRESLPREDSSSSSFDDGSTSEIYSLYQRNKGYFRSRQLLSRSEIDKPWIEAKKSRRQWSTIIPRTGLVIGFLAMGVLIWSGYASVARHNYCMVLEDDFNGDSLDMTKWSYEIELGGFGNGEFEMTTNSTENVFIDDGKLVIKPTLQDESLLTSNYTVLNLTDQGCTSTLWSNCWTSTNATNYTIINPVRSGRITTKNSASIRYGRVEVIAKMPVGDWLWPAIWMMPTNSIYGAWPASGEIDIAESRGNNYTYSDGGNNIVSSTLHWGPTAELDAYWMTYTKRRSLHTTYADDFHTFGLEWSDKYLYTYVDTRLHQVLYTPFDQPQWQRGGFPQIDHGVVLHNPWQTGRDSTPFDNQFFLILNVAVGGTNGFFRDSVGNKPWSNSFGNASAYFWQAKDQWYPTWTPGRAQMEVKNVKMWQEC